jgi:flagellar basal body-associated protein FliL
VAFDDLNVDDEEELIDASSKKKDISPWLIGWIVFCMLIIISLICGVIYVLFFLPKQQAVRLNFLTTERAVLQERVEGLLAPRTLTPETVSTEPGIEVVPKGIVPLQPTEREKFIATLEIFATQTSEALKFDQQLTHTAELGMISLKTNTPTISELKASSTPTAPLPSETGSLSPTLQISTQTETLVPTTQPPPSATMPPSATSQSVPEKKSGGVRVVEITLAPAMQTEVAEATGVAKATLIAVVTVTKGATQLNATTQPSPSETARIEETQESSPTSTPISIQVSATASQTATATTTKIPTIIVTSATKTQTLVMDDQVLIPPGTATHIILESGEPSPTLGKATEQAKVMRLSTTRIIEIVLIPSLIVLALLVLLVIILVRRNNRTEDKQD